MRRFFVFGSISCALSGCGGTVNGSDDPTPRIVSPAGGTAGDGSTTHPSAGTGSSSQGVTGGTFGGGTGALPAITGGAGGAAGAAPANTGGTASSGATGPLSGAAGEPATDECERVVRPSPGTGLCGAPSSVLPVEGAFGRAASWYYDLTTGACGVEPDVRLDAETSAAFLFRIDEAPYNNNVSALYPWSYELEGHTSSNDLPADVAMVARISHPCGIGIDLSFRFDSAGTVTVVDVSSR